MKSRFKIKYNLKIEVRNDKGKLVKEKIISNLITTAGKAGMAARLNGYGTPAAYNYLAVGTGTTGAVVGNTTLESEITDTGLARAQATASVLTTDTTNDTARLSYTWTASGAKAVTEAGVFNASSSGTLLARQVFSAINMAANYTLTLVWSFDVD